MSTFQAVVQQLQKNNQEEANRDNTLVKSLELHGEQNRVGFNKLIEKITGQLDGVRNTFEDAREEEANQQKEQKKLTATKKEEENRVARFMKFSLGAIKNLPKTMKNAVSKGMNKLIDTMKDIGKKGWNIAKKFLMVGALGVLLAFMNSKLWTQVTETLGKIKDGFMGMVSGLIEIKNAFFDKDGNLDVIAGLKKTWEKVTEGFKRLSDGITAAFFDEEGNYRTDNIVGQLTLIATGLIGVTLAWKTLRFAINAFKLGLTPIKFFGRGVYSAGRLGGGLFGSALRGIKGGWGTLGRGMSGFKTSLMDIGTSWGETNKNARKSGGWASKGMGGLRGRFGRLFSMVGRRGLLGLVAGAGVSMLAMVNFEKTKGIFSDAAGGLTKIFGNAFDVVKNFGSAIKNVASKAASKLASVVDNAKKTIAGDDAKTKTKRPEEIDAERKKANAADVDLKKKQAANLEKLRLKNQAIANKRSMDLFKNADKLSMKNFNAAQKAAAEIAEKTSKKAAQEIATQTSKEAAELIAKSATKSALKKIPILGIGAGLIFGFQRALEGDFIGAGAEVTSGVVGTFAGPGTVASMGIDAGLLASDLNKSGTFDGLKTSADGGAIEDVKTNNGGGTLIGPSLIKGGDSFSSSQTFSLEGMGDGNSQLGSSMSPFSIP